ncbi:MAG TPA: N-acetyltransferase [Gammaproteobacteria bacterium]|nr:N-acetyltransferase [Gammaproteobacteria bacterium]
MIGIRAHTADDDSAVWQVNKTAFPTPAEAGLVERLRAEAEPVISLVAEDDSGLVGHILFSPVCLAADSGFPAMGLAPMAVLPDRQRRDIGGAMLRAGLDACRGLGCKAVFVLGHPDYYPRFGFVAASRYGIESRFEVPDEAFMVLELEPGALEGLAGKMHYHPAFDAL